MGTRMCSIAASLAGVLAASPAMAADAERGGLLYENHCTVCHESTVHVRENRRVQTRPEILAMIERWVAHLELDWSAEEKLDVLEYLVRDYYRIAGGAM